MHTYVTYQAGGGMSFSVSAATEFSDGGVTNSTTGNASGETRVTQETASGDNERLALGITEISIGSGASTYFTSSVSFSNTMDGTSTSASVNTSYTYALDTYEAVTSHSVTSTTTYSGYSVTPEASTYLEFAMDDVASSATATTTHTFTRNWTQATTTEINTLGDTSSTTQETTTTCSSRTVVASTGSFPVWYTSNLTAISQASYSMLPGTVYVPNHDEILLTFGSGSHVLTNGVTRSATTIWLSDLWHTFALNTTQRNDSVTFTSTGLDVTFGVSTQAASYNVPVLFDATYSANRYGFTYSATSTTYEYTIGISVCQTFSAAGFSDSPRIVFEEDGKTYSWLASIATTGVFTDLVWEFGVGMVGQSSYFDSGLNTQGFVLTPDIRVLQTVSGNALISNSTGIGAVVTAAAPSPFIGIQQTAQFDFGSWVNAQGSDTYSTHKAFLFPGVKCPDIFHEYSDTLYFTTETSAITGSFFTGTGSDDTVSTSRTAYTTTVAASTTAEFAHNGSTWGYSTSTGTTGASGSGSLSPRTTGTPETVTYNDGLRAATEYPQAPNRVSPAIFGGSNGTQHTFSGIISAGHVFSTYGTDTSSKIETADSYFTTSGSVATACKVYPVIFGPCVLVLPRTYL